MFSLKSQINTLLNNSGFIRYFKNTSWTLAENLIRVICNLFIGIFLARYLGPNDFGLLSYIIAFSSLFSVIAKLGMDEVIVKKLVQFPADISKYLGTAFWCKIIAAVFTISATLIIAITIHGTSLTTLYIFIISCGVIFQASEIIDFYFQSKVSLKFSSITRQVQLIISTVLKLYLIYIKAELLYFVLVIAFDQMLLAAIFIIVYNRSSHPQFNLNFSFKTAKELLMESWPLILSSVVAMIYMRIDQLMIQDILGQHEVGLYSAAIRISEAWYFFPILITKSLFPAIINAKSNNAFTYYSRLQKLYSLLVWVAISAALLTTFFSNSIVMTLYGAAYKEAAYILTIHIWTGVFVCLGVASSNWMILEGLQRLAFYRTLGGAIINVILNLILIDKYGLIGAAIATLVAQSFAALIFDVFLVSTRDNFYMKLKAINFFKIFQPDITP